MKESEHTCAQRRVAGGAAMTDRNYWSGFSAGAVVGALAGIGGILVFKNASANKFGRVIRLEKSVQVGRSVDEVYQAWSHFDRLPQLISFVQDVRVFGERSHWSVAIDGKTFEWDAEVVQRIPNESIGWKSVSGPKHTGRIHFSSIGAQTMVHVTMNYAPPLGRLGGLVPVHEYLESYIEQGLREFKYALEGTGTESIHGQATGTYGSDPAAAGSTLPGSPTGGAPGSKGPVGTPGEHAAPGTVDYTRPPKGTY
jgi:uncharacterized membrane protein